MMEVHLYNDVFENRCNIVSFIAVRLLVIGGFVRGRIEILLAGGIGCVLLSGGCLGRGGIIRVVLGCVSLFAGIVLCLSIRNGES